MSQLFLGESLFWSDSVNGNENSFHCYTSHTLTLRLCHALDLIFMHMHVHVRTVDREIFVVKIFRRHPLPMRIKHKYIYSAITDVHTYQF